MAAALADHLGLAGNFYVFSALNLAGAVLVYFYLRGTPAMPVMGASGHSALAVWREHLRTPALRAAFAIGFCILFAFIGTFTYVNFVLVQAPLSLSMMALGFVYFVFAPSIATTPLAGRAVARLGVQRTFWTAIAIALAGLPMLVVASLPVVLVGLALVGVGTFLAQAVATGFVGRVATDRGSASGMYLASYFAGGLVGSAVLGLAFDHFGWGACVSGVGLALGLAALLGARLRIA
jgi:predicted MFS family arabinose efflux permease